MYTCNCSPQELNVVNHLRIFAQAGWQILVLSPKLFWPVFMNWIITNMVFIEVFMIVKWENMHIFVFFVEEYRRAPFSSQSKCRKLTSLNVGFTNPSHTYFWREDNLDCYTHFLIIPGLYWSLGKFSFVILNICRHHHLSFSPIVAERAHRIISGVWVKRKDTASGVRLVHIQPMINLHLPWAQ